MSEKKPVLNPGREHCISVPVPSQRTIAITIHVQGTVSKSAYPNMVKTLDLDEDSGNNLKRP